MNRRRFIQAAALSAAAPSIIPNALTTPPPIDLDALFSQLYHIKAATWIYPGLDEFLAHDARIRESVLKAIGFPPPV